METREHIYDVAIIGAGVCGLYAGLSAVRQGKSVALIEKEKYVGGLAAGFQFGENMCDFGVHMLHAHNREIFEDCARMMGKERIEVALDARIQWGSALCKYPLKFTDLIKVMPILTLARCVSGLLSAELKRALQFHTFAPKNAEQALIEYYGSPLYAYFFEGFTHKYWGIHPKELSAEFIRRKMPRLSAFDFLRGLVKKLIPIKSSTQTNGELVESALDTETLHYSKTGSEALPRSLESEFLQRGGHLFTGQLITSIEKKGDHYEIQVPDKKLSTARVLNTAPISSFVKLLPFAPPSVIKSSQKLRYKPAVVEAFLVCKEKCIDALYVYYRNRIFHRIGEPKNAGMQISPRDHTLLIVESTCELGDERWGGKGSHIQEVIHDLEREGVCKERDIVSHAHLRNAYAYPIYSVGFEENFFTIESWLAGFPTIASTGRQGGFCYPAMHSAMQMGKDAVHELLKIK